MTIRMAMAFALPGLIVPGVIIENPDCVAKTFPDYFSRLESLRGGARSRKPMRPNNGVKRLSVGVLGLVLELVIGAFPGRAAGSATDTPTLVVNVAQTFRPVTHVAAGGLYGLGSDTTPADDMVAPLHPR